MRELLTGGLLAAVGLALGYVRWLRAPGQRDAKLLVTGGPLLWLHDRRLRARGMRPRGTTVALLGCVDALLVTGDEDDEDLAPLADAGPRDPLPLPWDGPVTHGPADDEPVEHVE